MSHNTFGSSAVTAFPELEESAWLSRVKALTISDMASLGSLMLGGGKMTMDTFDLSEELFDTLNEIPIESRDNVLCNCLFSKELRSDDVKGSLDSEDGDYLLFKIEEFKEKYRGRPGFDELVGHCDAVSEAVRARVEGKLGVPLIRPTETAPAARGWTLGLRARMGSVVSATTRAVQSVVPGQADPDHDWTKAARVGVCLLRYGTLKPPQSTSSGDSPTAA